MEPRAAAPERRIETLHRLSAAGIPTGVMFAPIIPALNDMYLENVIEAAAGAGAQYAGYVVLRLPHELKELFRSWLDLHYPMRADHVMARVRDLRDGKENDTAFGRRFKGTGAYSSLIAQRFRLACKKHALNRSRHDFPTDLFVRPTQAGAQMTLF